MTSDAPVGPPYEISVHPDRGFFELVWHGQIGLDAVRDAYADVAAHPDWKPHFNRLVVYTAEADLDDMTFADIDAIKTALSDWQADHAPGHSLFGANVVESPFFDALGAVWEALYQGNETLTVRIFKARDAATDWLDGVRLSAPDA